MNKTRKYSPEVRERAVRLVAEHAGGHCSGQIAEISPPLSELTAHSRGPTGRTLGPGGPEAQRT